MARKDWASSPLPSNRHTRRARCGDLEVLVEDWDRLSGNDFMGRLDPPLALDELRDKARVRRWFALAPAAGETRQTEREKARGEVELVLRWRYNPSLDFFGEAEPEEVL